MENILKLDAFLGASSVRHPEKLRAQIMRFLGAAAGRVAPIDMVHSILLSFDSGLALIDMGVY